MKLWHDDVRPPPEGWKWARTNDEAKEWLSKGTITEVSLDHDLGLEELQVPEEVDNWEAIFEIIALKGQAEETGYDLVEWMIENECVPACITIHSWNPDGAMRMAMRLADAGHDCLLAPFQVPK